MEFLLSFVYNSKGGQPNIVKNISKFHILNSYISGKTDKI